MAAEVEDKSNKAVKVKSGEVSTGILVGCGVVTEFGLGRPVEMGATKCLPMGSPG